MPYKIEIVKGDITKADTEAIVNAANKHFWMCGGVMKLQNNRHLPTGRFFLKTA